MKASVEDSHDWKANDVCTLQKAQLRFTRGEAVLRSRRKTGLGLQADEERLIGTIRGKLRRGSDVMRLTEMAEWRCGAVEG